MWWWGGGKGASTSFANLTICQHQFYKNLKYTIHYKLYLLTCADSSTNTIKSPNPQKKHEEKISCHVTGVRCLVSGVRWQVPHVKCQMSLMPTATATAKDPPFNNSPPLCTISLLVKTKNKINFIGDFDFLCNLEPPTYP